MKRLFISCTARLLASIFTYESFASQSSNIDGKDQFLGASPLTQNARTIDPYLLDAADEEGKRIEREAEEARVKAEAMRKAKDIARERDENIKNRRSEDLAEVEVEYNAAKKALISALKNEIYVHSEKPSELSGYEGSWYSFKRGNVFACEFDRSEDRDDKYIRMLLKVEEFLRSSLLYWQAIYGFHSGESLEEFFESIRSTPNIEWQWSEISSDDLVFVRKILLEFFHGIKYMEHVSEGIVLNNIRSDIRVADFVDGKERYVHAIALRYANKKANGEISRKGSKVVDLMLEIEKSMLIANMLRRNIELEEQVNLIVDSKGYNYGYFSNIADVARDTQLRNLANVLNWKYNTCYMDNSVGKIFAGNSDSNGHTKMGDKILTIKKSLGELSLDIEDGRIGPKEGLDKLSKKYRSLTKSLESLLICAQHTLNLGSVCLDLDDFIILLNYLNEKNNEKWFCRKFSRRLVLVISEIREALECWQICDCCAKKLGVEIPNECCSKLLLDKSGGFLAYQDVVNRRYSDILSKFIDIISNLSPTKSAKKDSDQVQNDPSKLPDPSNGMKLTARDFYNICKEVEEKFPLVGATHEMSPASLAIRTQAKPVSRQEGDSSGSTVRPPHASSVSLNPSPEFGEFLGAQPEKKGLEAQEGLSEKTTETAQKRKEDSRQEESYQKVRRFNDYDENIFVTP